MNNTIDFNKLITLVTPVYKQGENAILFIKSLIKPLKTIYATFTAYRTATFYNVAFTSQVIYLEKLLNDKYNPTGFDPIYITDADVLDINYIFNVNEQIQDIYYHNVAESEMELKVEIVPVYLYNHSEYLNNYDFTVNWPSDITYDDDEVHAFVNRLKLAGKRFNIKEF